MFIKIYHGQGIKKYQKSSKNSYNNKNIWIYLKRPYIWLQPLPTVVCEHSCWHRDPAGHTPSCTPRNPKGTQTRQLKSTSRPTSPGTE